MTHTVASSSARALVVTLTLAASAVPAFSQTSAQNVINTGQNVLGQPVVSERPSLLQEGVRRAPDTSLGGLFRDTVRDFQRLPSKDTALWLTFGGVAAGLGRTMDNGVSAGLSKSSTMDDVLFAGQRAGGARMQLAAAVATYTAGRISGHSKISEVGGDLLRAQIMSQVLTAGIKFAAGRTRPDGTQYSFPSGHTSVTFATATVLQRDLGWKAGLPAYGLATYVAASRIQDKRHFLSDVTFGAALGIVAGRTVTIGRGDAKFALSPAATPGGVGANFNWVGKK